MNNLATSALMGLGGFLGTPDYAGAADKYADTLAGLADSYQPYIRGGRFAQRGLGGLGIMQMADPASLENRLAASFQDSPYQQQILKDTQDQMNANAAMMGTLNSTAQQAALQRALASQQNQWQQQYIDRATQQYNQGYRGLSNLGMLMAQQGFGAQGRANQLLQEAALGRLKGAVAPTPFENALTGALGAYMGG